MNSETELSSLPSYQHYVQGHNIKKTSNGFALDSTYYKKYYSMIDTEIYFGDEYVEDAHDIQWQISQQVMPLFGYNSYILDEYAKGNRIISGSFTINFTGANEFDNLLKEAGYAKGFPKTYDISGNAGTPNAHKNEGKQIDEPDKKPMWDVNFDIDVICMNDRRGGAPVHLVLQNAAISACGQASQATGGVMQQRYTFFARDILTAE
jgi:hypothetical protein